MGKVQVRMTLIRKGKGKDLRASNRALRVGLRLCRAKLKLDLWDGYATGFFGVLSLDGIEVVSDVWEGPFPGRERIVRPESKDSIFNRIAASEGASHGSETRLSSATSSPPLWLYGSSVSFLNDPASGRGVG